MNNFDEIKLQPSKPHQCMHYAEGIRCRSYAIRNEYTCFHHRLVPAPTVVACDPFELATLDSRAAIQAAVSEITYRLANKTIDDRRASLILYALQIASSNLSAFNGTYPPAAPDPPVVPGPPDGQPALL